jgi:alpha-tubulin suppressor-like RCC1 family protein
MRVTAMRFTYAARLIFLAATVISALCVTTARTAADQPYGWGYNADGQLGDGTGFNKWNTPQSVLNLTNVVAMAGGFRHSLALAPDGTVYAWGGNDYLQIPNYYQTVPGPVDGLPLPAVAISAGFYHSLALLADGAVWGWGSNSQGQLGNGESVHSSPLVPMSITDVVAIAGGSNHTVVLKSDGTVWATGYNLYGQLGDGTFTERHSPVQVTGLPAGIIAVAAGGMQSMALASDGTVYAWGNNEFGQVGNGRPSTRARPSPSRVFLRPRPCLTTAPSGGGGATAAGSWATARPRTG